MVNCRGEPMCSPSGLFMKQKVKKSKISKAITQSNIAIVVGEFNQDICEGLLQGALKTLQKIGFQKNKIRVISVPGAFEIPLAAAWLAQKKKADAVICLGAVIRGDTAHFDYVCQAVTEGLTRVQLDYRLPIAFGVLTVDTKAQAVERASDNDFNKGAEATMAVLKMLEVKESIYGQ